MPATPTSPPKRMTRARAKAVEEKKKSTATSATKATTARAAATKKPTAATTAAAKRKAKADEAKQTEVEDDPLDDELAEASSKAAAKPAAAPQSKPRGRPRKNTVSKDPPAPSAPATRTRAAATRKKVTFQDDEDKENAKEITAEKAAVKAKVANTSMNAKPIRRGTAAANTAKPAPKKSAQPRVPSPLSPKKETQVAKGNAVVQEDSEDELEQPSGPCVSPSKKAGESIGGLCAKRPPPSPFKDAMKESPRKVHISVARDAEQKPEVDAPAHNLLSQSPRKVQLSSTVHAKSHEAADESLGKSFFRSPPRRPASPIKGFGAGTPGQGSSFQGLDLTASVLKSKTPQRFNFSPAKNLTLAFKAAHVDSTSQPAKQVEAEMPPDCISRTTPTSDKRGDLPIEDADAELRQDCEMNDVEDELTEGMAENAAFLAQDQETMDGLIDESEDELHSENNVYHATPATAKRARLSAHFRPEITPAATTPSGENPEAPVPFSALAEKFGQWQGATPDQDVVQQRRMERSMFSPLQQLSRLSMTEDDLTEVMESIVEPVAESQPTEEVTLHIDETPTDMEASTLGSADAATDMNFAQDFVICEDAPADEDMADANVNPEPELFRQSQISEASQEYGDENASPIDASRVSPRRAAAVPTATCTPVRAFQHRGEVCHTVSKVPLKPSADFDMTPLHVPKKRGHSLSASLTPRAELDLQAMRQIYPSASELEAAESDSASVITTATSRMGQTLAPAQAATPRRVTTGSLSASGITPGKADRQLLKGVVAYVDVHTAEGAEASSIFVELLGQMGARCVKQWNWNSRASVGPNSPQPGDEGERSKIGVTHVVFKDGGKRTMEKVREAKGRVHCVGVGWVLDCERENRWLDEAEYAVDQSLIPRGGQRRRKSMEPKSLSHLHGSLSAADSPSKLSPPLMSPTKEFLDLNTPGRRETSSVSLDDRRVSFAPAVGASPESPSTPQRGEETPRGYSTPPVLGYAESTYGSPTTPYFLHPDHLVQQTCPPKQNQELFFPVSGRIDEADESMRRRLLLARRKSLQFAPKVRSPLAHDE